MKKLISLLTFVVALAAGLVFANGSMAGNLNRIDNVNNGVTYFSTGSISFDNFDMGLAAAIEEGSSCSEGSGAGGVTAGWSGGKNGITNFSTGPASFDSGTTGPDTGGSCVKSAPREINNGRWPEDFS